MDPSTAPRTSVTPMPAGRRSTKRRYVIAVCVVLAGVSGAVPAVGASKAKAKNKAKTTRPPIELVTNVREAKVIASSTFVNLGSFDSQRPKLGEIKVECKGGRKAACRITSSVAGPLRLKNGGVVSQTPPAATATGKGKNRTPGGVGGGGGGGGGTATTAPSSSSAPPSSSQPTNPPGGGDEIDIDIDWNPCFFDDSLCFHITYDMGGNGVVAQPDGSGDTVDGLPGDINIGRGSPRL